MDTSIITACSNDYNFDKVSFKSFGLEWNSIDKLNAQKLWPLEQGSYSGHLRQIADRQWRDLIEQNRQESGILVSKKTDSSTAIAGTPDEGAELYLRATTGTITTVAPSGSGQFVRVIGYCIEISNNRIYFNPDNTYIEIA